MIPEFIREMAEDRAAGLPWEAVAERYGYGSAKAAQNALYNAAARDPSLRRAVRPYGRQRPMTIPYDHAGRHVRTPFDVSDPTNSPGLLLCTAPTDEAAAALAELLNAAWAVLDDDAEAARARLAAAFAGLRPGAEL